MTTETMTNNLPYFVTQEGYTINNAVSDGYKIANLQQQIESAKARKAIVLETISMEFADEIDSLQRRIDFFKPSLEAWTADNLGNKKSINFGVFTAGFRRSESLEILDEAKAVEYSKQKGIAIKETASKNAIKDAIKHTGELPPDDVAVLIQKDTFFISTGKEGAL